MEGNQYVSNVVDDKSYFIGRSNLDTVSAGLKVDRRQLMSVFEVLEHQSLLKIPLMPRCNVSTY